MPYDIGKSCKIVKYMKNNAKFAIGDIVRVKRTRDIGEICNIYGNYGAQRPKRGCIQINIFGSYYNLTRNAEELKLIKRVGQRVGLNDLSIRIGFDGI